MVVSSGAQPDLHAFVTQKLTKVFGERRAAELIAQLLRELHFERIATVDELAKAAELLQSRGGFEATAGAMLAVHAQMLRMGRR